MSNEKKELIEKMKDTLDRPGGKQAVRFLLNSLGSIPVGGGVFAATSAIWGEKDQQKFNKIMTEWASKTDDDLKGILDNLNTLLQKPTKAKMSLLIGELVEKGLANQILSQYRQPIRLMLNGESVNELQPFIKENWLSLSPNGCTAQMGSGNISGNNIEELKRPWGMGAGFTLTVNESFFLD